jgi:hypothetical protein
MTGIYIALGIIYRDELKDVSRLYTNPILFYLMDLNKIFFSAVLVIDLRASGLLDQQSTTGAMTPVIMYLSILGF